MYSGDTGQHFTNDKKSFVCSYSAERNLGDTKIICKIAQTDSLKKLAVVLQKMIVSFSSIFFQHLTYAFHHIDSSD